MPDRGALRRANFFRATMRDPDAHTAPDAAINEALLVVGASIDAQAKSDGRQLSTVQRERALSVAQRLLRSLPRDQLHSISAHSGMLKSITDQSLTVTPVTEPRAVAAARLDDRSQGVEAGSDPASAPFGRRALDDDGRPTSSSRFAELGPASEATRVMQEARGEAIRLGMPWAANNQDLLRLGAPAIRTLHEAGVQRQTFERMTSDKVGIRAATAVNFAAWARRHNMTPEQTNRLMNNTSDLHERLSAGRPAEERREVQRDLDASFGRFLARPNTPEARRALEDDRMRHARTEQDRQHIRENTRELERASHNHAAAVRNDAPATARRDADIATRDADVGARNSDVARHREATQSNDAALAGLNAPAAAINNPGQVQPSSQPRTPPAPRPS